MLDDDEGHAAVGRGVAQQGVQGFEPAGRTADADNRKVGLRQAAGGVDLFSAGVPPQTGGPPAVGAGAG